MSSSNCRIIQPPGATSYLPSLISAIDSEFKFKVEECSLKREALENHKYQYRYQVLVTYDHIPKTTVEVGTESRDTSIKEKEKDKRERETVRYREEESPLPPPVYTKFVHFFVFTEGFSSEQQCYRRYMAAEFPTNMKLRDAFKYFLDESHVRNGDNVKLYYVIDKSCSRRLWTAIEYPDLDKTIASDEMSGDSPLTLVADAVGIRGWGRSKSRSRKTRRD